jgi:hypothetical protein
MKPCRRSAVQRRVLLGAVYTWIRDELQGLSIVTDDTFGKAVTAVLVCVRDRLLHSESV